MKRCARVAVVRPGASARLRLAAARRKQTKHGCSLSHPCGVTTDPRVPSVELGELVAVVYRTKKGADTVLTDYTHEFAHPRPRLAYNESGLLIAGGAYRVEVRGIVD